MSYSVEASEAQPLLQRQPHGHESQSTLQRTRQATRRFLTSKVGHYSVLGLVSLDVSCIFADFILSLYVCEHTCKNKPTSPGFKPDLENIAVAQDVLEVVSLVFSCLFLAELIASLWAFGFSYFKSKFHCFDALIILAGFIVDVCLKGVLEEIGSIVVVLRLWRVVKIVEELSAGAEEQMEQMTEKLEAAEREKSEAVKELEGLRRRSATSGDA